MNRTSQSLLAGLVLAAVLLGAAVPAGAEQQPSAEVLLPYFEVNLLNANASNTLFSVGNSLNRPVGVELAIYTNWGIPIAKSNVTLAARQVRSFNVRSWLAGNLPSRKLNAGELNHFKAALTGQRSPKDKLFYGSQVAPGLAVGYVRIKTVGQPQPRALWGDYFLLDSVLTSAEGDTLINLDSSAGCIGGCKRHALRFLTSGTFDAGTRVVILSDVAAKPSASPQLADYVQADTLAFDEAGQPLGGNRLRLLPVQIVSIADLALHQAAGWIDLQTEATSIVAVHYTSKKAFGVALMSYCLPDDPDPVPSGLRLEKRTNGQDANAVPGPSIKVGAPVLWEYIVENTGDVRLVDIEVSDDDSRISVSCPKSELAPGERMICTGHGTAEACQYENLGTATARTEEGGDLSAEDLSHYFGAQDAAIEIELLINGQDADTPAGPTVDAGSRIDWTYKVTNTGEVALDNVKVSDDHGGAVSCPQTSLRPGESMTCTASSTAAAGQSGRIAKATGRSACSEVRDEDAAYYFGGPIDPGIAIKKLTNGDDTAAAPGKSLPLGSIVRWDYIVSNIGSVKLDGVKVADDKEGAIACPKSSLQPGESMTCSQTGVVKACQYSNVGTVSAISSGGKASSHSDASFYFGQTSPALQVKSFVNGQAADGDAIPTFEAGTALQWAFKVTNTGNVALRNVSLSADHVANVSCPKSSLQLGESMTCSAGGAAAEGPFNNLSTANATADTVCGGNAGASGPGRYLGLPVTPKLPELKIEKLTNGEDYGAPGRNLPFGSPVRWDYRVTNTGPVRVENIQVTDDREGAVSCPKSALEPGEWMICSKTGVAKACQYSNVGTVKGVSAKGQPATASDANYYFGQTSPALRITSYTNGQDDSVEIPAGSPVKWTYVVTNTGNVSLRDVQVTDDHLGKVSCPKSSLQPGESMTCSASGTAIKGPYSNMGTATGTADTVCGGNASAGDPSHYTGINLPPPCNGVPSIAELWPPNHKFVDIQVLGIVDPNGDPVAIKVTGITQDEPVNEKGDGNTGPDGAGVGTSTAQVRAERSGLGDGRVYAIHYSATDNQGASCTGTVFVGVPHDQRGTPPVDSGQIYDSTVSK